MAPTTSDPPRCVECERLLEFSARDWGRNDDDDPVCDDCYTQEYADEQEEKAGER